jgi:hypothetical protein
MPIEIGIQSKAMGVDLFYGPVLPADPASLLMLIATCCDAAAGSSLGRQDAAGGLWFNEAAASSTARGMINIWGR